MAHRSRREDAILIGQGLQGTTRIGPGDVVHTLVSVRNYCGVAPKPPVSVAFRQGSTVIAAAPLTGTDVSGVPPCGGYPGTKNDIQMSPWAPGPAPA